MPWCPEGQPGASCPCVWPAWRSALTVASQCVICHLVPTWLVESPVVKWNTQGSSSPSTDDGYIDLQFKKSPPTINPTEDHCARYSAIFDWHLPGFYHLCIAYYASKGYGGYSYITFQTWMTSIHLSPEESDGRAPSFKTLKVKEFSPWQMFSKTMARHNGSFRKMLIELTIS